MTQVRELPLLMPSCPLCSTAMEIFDVVPPGLFVWARCPRVEAGECNSSPVKMLRKLPHQQLRQLADRPIPTSRAAKRKRIREAWRRYHTDQAGGLADR